MTSIYDLKPKFQNLLRPLCGRLARGGVTPNQVTVAALVLSIAAGAAIAATNGSFFGAPPAHGGARWALVLLPVVLFVRMALNAIDGMLAREFNLKSPFGAVLNELGDVVSDMALYLPFALIPGVSPVLTGLVVAIAVMTEMAGVVAIQVGVERRYDGPFGKSDRALFFGALAVVIAVGVMPGLWTNIALGLAAAAGALTIINRVRAALRANQ